MKSILDRSFKYTPSHQTSVAKTFARIRKQQQAEKREKSPVVTWLARRDAK